MARNETLVSGAKAALDRLKFEVAAELGFPFSDKLAYEMDGELTGPAPPVPTLTPANYRQVLDRMKYEVAEELGLGPQIKDGYWGELSSAACGAVGGRLGGKLGGNMVRKMVAFAEQYMLNRT